MRLLEEKCAMIADVFDLPVVFFQKNNEILFEIKKENLYNPFISVEDEPFHSAKIMNQYVEIPRIRKSNFLEKFILLSVSKHDEFLGTLIIGPCLSSQVAEERLLLLIKEHHAFSAKEEVLHYYRSLPIYSTEKLVKIGAFISYFLKGTSLNTTDIKDDYLHSLTLDTTNKRETKLANPITFSNSIHERKFENEILKIVKNGEVEKLDKVFVYKEEEEVAIYSKSSHLRSLKNHLITLTALVSRASIDGGLHGEIALEASDRYILRIEEMYTTEDLYKMTVEMLHFFTQKVRESKTQQYSLPVVKAIHFIISNITEELLHQQIADYAGVTPNYLSYLFKKDTDETMSVFIQKARIEEAKHLLNTTSASISEISELLAFTDQSYFTKIFKKHQGVTPNQYRNQKEQSNAE